MKTHHKSALLLSGLALAATSGYGIINFELTPTDVTPTDNSALSTSAQYNDGGILVSFGFGTIGTDGIPVVTSPAYFERVGATDSVNGFFNDTLGVGDTESALADSSLDSWFLRGGSATSNAITVGQVFVITYDPTTRPTSASGEIWDIDSFAEQGTEGWLVEARNESGDVIGFNQSPIFPATDPVSDTTSLDGQEWNFSFNGLLEPISYITFTFNGTKTTGIGLAFDNFSASEPFIPEPSSAALLVAAGAGVMIARRRK